MMSLHTCREERGELHYQSSRSDALQFCPSLPPCLPPSLPPTHLRLSAERLGCFIGYSTRVDSLSPPAASPAGCVLNQLLGKQASGVPCCRLCSNSFTWGLHVGVTILYQAKGYYEISLGRVGGRLRRSVPTSPSV